MAAELKEIKNLLIVGPSQHGKSSFANFLHQGRVTKYTERKFAAGNGIEKCTLTPDFVMMNYTYDIKGTISNSTKTIPNICIIDTPGLQDTEGKDLDVLKELLRFSKKYQKEGVHGLCYVARYKVPLKPEFFETMRYYSELFSEVSRNNSSLIITGVPCTPDDVDFEESNGFNVSAEVKKIYESVSQALGYRIPFLHIDSLPRDLITLNHAKSVRNTVLLSLDQKRSSDIRIIKIPKPPQWLIEDNKEIQNLAGLREGLVKGIEIASVSLTNVTQKLSQKKEKKNTWEQELDRRRIFINDNQDGSICQFSQNYDDEWHFLYRASRAVAFETNFIITSVTVTGGELETTALRDRSFEGIVSRGLWANLNATIRAFALKSEYFREKLMRSELKIEELTKLLENVVIEIDELSNSDTSISEKLGKLNDEFDSLESRIKILSRRYIKIDDAIIRLGGV